MIIHLFSGKHGDSWRKEDWGEYEIITVDIEENGAQNLHCPAVWGYLVGLAQRGLVKGIIGGPPCRTISRMRHQSPGPPPLRGRDDLRYGLPGIGEDLQEKADGDVALFWKQLGLWIMADDARCTADPSPAMLLESPMDPMRYMASGEAAGIPSFWNFEEVIQFTAENRMSLVHLDQGAVGHARRKPTTLMTNLPGMEDLNGLQGGGTEALANDLNGRLEQSKGWSTWAPGLVQAIKVSMKWYLQMLDMHLRDRRSGGAQVKSMTLDQWKQHVRRGHTPFDRRCRLCMKEAGVDRQHRRLKAAIPSYVLNVDIVGPFIQGRDVGLSSRGEKVKYIMLATVAIPLIEDEKVGDGYDAGLLPDEVLGDDLEAGDGLPSSRLMWKR